MEDPRIIRVEWARLEGRRPLGAGSNSRLSDHGVSVNMPIARVTAEDGSTGFGACFATRRQLQRLLGIRLQEVFSPERGVVAPWLSCEYPLWDLVAKREGVPVYELAAAVAGAAVPNPLPPVPCYDTSLYFDDLHLPSDDRACALLAAEAREGYERGHRAFKIKVGRGARHMPLEEGTRRDVAIVRAVRAAVGPEAKLMLDANNGYNLNLAKRVLSETAACDIFWIEEAFHEDPVLYRDLHEWLDREKLSVLIADGEGRADPDLPEWARKGLVDVVQYDIFDHGLTRWLATGSQLDAWGVRSAPHHYGTHYGNYAACHLAGAIRGFAYVEWDEASTPGLDTSSYVIGAGSVKAPDKPGFGLELDGELFGKVVQAKGLNLSL